MDLVVRDRGRARGHQGAMDASCMGGTQAVSLLEWAAALCAPGISIRNVCIGIDTTGVAESADIVATERKGGRVSTVEGGDSEYEEEKQCEDGCGGEIRLVIAHLLLYSFGDAAQEMMEGG